MKKLAIFAAVAAGLAGIGLSHLYFKRLEAEVAGGPRVPVLVAAEDIALGALLDKSMLAVRDIPEAYVEQRHIRAADIKKILGARTSQGVHVNEAVLYSDLSTYSEHVRRLSGLIQEGMRAAVIDSSDARFQGLLRPGDRVDVLLTTGVGQTQSKTVTLLQNLLLLSVGRDLGSARTRGTGAAAYSPAGGGSMVTLSVTTEQAQIITQAKVAGQLTLTLRNPDDIQLVEGIAETTQTDVARAKERLNWRTVSAPEKKEIDHVR